MLRYPSPDRPDVLAQLERAHKEIDTLAEALEAAERRAVASERHADEEGNAD